ncbi:MAG TPA: YihY/virulence factor BrkB family protein [Gaiellaceae bacterium]|nr:YihY/virulence factor BrkB family protein [Gaiellaceae bacterium]
MAPPRSGGKRLARLWELARVVAHEFRRHDLLTYSSAIAFRGLVALVPLTLLGLALLGALGLQSVWTDTLAPAVEGRVTTPVYEGIDHSVRRILSSGTAGLITFAAALLLWDLVWAVGAVISALNRIHDVEERRSGARLVLVRLWLAVAVGACIIGAALVVLALPRAGDGAVDFALGIGRWVVGVTLLGLAVGLLVRYAPAERPQIAWASAGSLLVIATWIVASLLFRFYVASVADFTTAVGTLTVFLVLTAYVFTSATIFMAGAQLDELLRKDAEAGESVGVLQLLRAAFGR